MKERVKKLGGEITIISSTGEGTEVKVCLNLETIPNSIDSEKE